LTGLGLLMRARNRHRARDIHGRPRGSDGAWMLRGAALKACSWRGLRVERHEHGNCCNVGGVDQSCQVTVKARSKVRLKIKEIRFSWCDEDDRARGGVDEWRRTEAFARLIHLGSRCAKSYGSKVWTAESEGLGMRVLCAEAAKWYFIARPGVKRSALRAREVPLAEIGLITFQLVKNAMPMLQPCVPGFIGPNNFCRHPPEGRHR